MRNGAGWVAALLLVIGCGGGVEPESPARGDAQSPKVALARLPSPGASGISVMTRNLYLGTDVDTLLNAPSLSALPLLVAQGYADVVASDPAGRMAKIADEIAAAQPHLVGLQEVDLIRTQFPGDSLSPNPTPATQVAFDYLQLLLDALQARGLDYVAVAVSNEADIEAPALTPNGLMDVRLTDRDVLLARADVEVTNPEAHHFSTELSFHLGGTGPLVTVHRGWVEADATIGQRTVHVADTHLESAAPPVQVLQGSELAGHLAAESRPVILLGDLNSQADGSGTPSYAHFLDAGFADAWTEAHPRSPGLTCCNAADLLNPLSTFTQRIDFVLVHLPATANMPFVGAAQAVVVGTDPAEKTATGRWPSDHGGVQAILRLPAGVRFVDR